MARIDDYKNAVELGKSDLRKKNIDGIQAIKGIDLKDNSEGGTVLTLKFLNRTVNMGWPGCDFFFDKSDEEVPIQQQVLLLHYLNGVGESTLSNDWIAYQEVPDGKFYLDAFLRRAKNPMVQAFGERPELLVDLAKEVYIAEEAEQGDFSIIVQALPLIPVALILWEGDDEFPPEGNILFDRSISTILSAEDIAWLAGMVIYPLIGMAGNR